MQAVSHFQVSVDVNRKQEKSSILQSRLFRHPSGVGGSDVSMDSLSLLAVDQDTLDEYELTQPINAEYTSKIAKWINTGKYHCTATSALSSDDIGAAAASADIELNLKLGEVFDFRLKKKAKSDLDKVRE